jgi:antitoxin ParD1/3/4
MNVSLNPKLARFVEEQLKAGKYSSPEDVVNAGLARLQTEQELSAEDVTHLRGELAVGIDQADRGELEPWDAGEIHAEVERRAAEERSGQRRKGA